ncbi:MAG: enoyl-CoA hydratase/isomerase family protein [Sphingomonadaceae bacterium]|nr:enoyl-CoA hydratase/isomerase family protein [Sphingomonadaceae bacterium]
MTEYQTIRLDLGDSVATITLARPERLNAAPPEMADEIVAALGKALEGGARALILTGEGRAFCSGADLLGGRDRSHGLGGAAARAALEGSYNPMMLALAELPIPIVSAVNGPAAGIGCSIALAGDFVLAARSAYFLQAFVNIGLVPDGGASWTLPRLIGKSRAAEMMMLGERIGAEKAEAWGLIYRAVDDEALMGEASALASRLASGPTLALGLMRRGLARALDQGYAEAMQAEAENQGIAGNSADAREGAMAFLAKRKPEFRGN